MATKNLGAFLDQQGGIATLMPHARRLIELRRLFAAALPEPLRRGSSLANIKQGKLVVFVSNGAIATKLRLLGPSLTEQLSKRATEVTGLEVHVQPTGKSRQLSEKTNKISKSGAESLASLYEQLPDSELKNTIERMSKRSRS